MAEQNLTSLDEVRSLPFLYEGMPPTIHSVLAYLGVRTWGDLAALSDFDLVRKGGLTHAMAAKLRAALAARGLKFEGHPDEEPPASFSHGHAGPARRPRIKPIKPACGVYVIGCREFVKIGHALNIKSRLVALSHASPFEIELLAYKPVDPERRLTVEREIHERLASSRHKGEWFRKTPAVLALIDELNEDIIDACAESRERAKNGKTIEGMDASANR